LCGSGAYSASMMIGIVQPKAAGIVWSGAPLC
jgi:hypothetical protein